LNVVSNAVDACREDESSWKIKEVQIQTLKSPEGGVEYHVTDNGSGMEEEVKQKIFQSFFTTKGKQGTGIGLMLTKKIIDAHQGTIRVSTEKGKGTAFVIHLPEIVGDE
jgi:signal transduction histidine kinase